MSVQINIQKTELGKSFEIHMQNVLTRAYVCVPCVYVYVCGGDRESTIALILLQKR